MCLSIDDAWCVYLFVVPTSGIYFVWLLCWFPVLAGMAASILRDDLVLSKFFAIPWLLICLIAGVRCALTFLTRIPIWNWLVDSSSIERMGKTSRDYMLEMVGGTVWITLTWKGWIKIFDFMGSDPALDLYWNVLNIKRGGPVSWLLAKAEIVLPAELQKDKECWASWKTFGVIACRLHTDLLFGLQFFAKMMVSEGITNCGCPVQSAVSRWQCRVSSVQQCPAVSPYSNCLE